MRGRSSPLHPNSLSLSYTLSFHFLSFIILIYPFIHLFLPFLLFWSTPPPLPYHAFPPSLLSHHFPPPRFPLPLPLSSYHIYYLLFLFPSFPFPVSSIPVLFSPPAPPPFPPLPHPRRGSRSRRAFVGPLESSGRRRRKGAARRSGRRSVTGKGVLMPPILWP